MMTLFDAPDRESSCVMRSRTNTSLQSLGLLNETQRVEIARSLADRLLRDKSTDEQRLVRLFRMLTCSDPIKAQLDACINLLNRSRKRYSETSEDAAQLVATGDAQRDETIAATELAAWTHLTTIVLASDAAITLY